jgi:glucan phosphorylase
MQPIQTVLLLLAVGWLIMQVLRWDKRLARIQSLEAFWGHTPAQEAAKIQWRHALLKMTDRDFELVYQFYHARLNRLPLTLSPEAFGRLLLLLQRHRLPLSM